MKVSYIGYNSNEEQFYLCFRKFKDICHPVQEEWLVAATLWRSRQLFLSLWVAAHYQEKANRGYCEINQSETSMRLVPFLVLESFSCTIASDLNTDFLKKVTLNNDFSFK